MIQGLVRMVFLGMLSVIPGASRADYLCSFTVRSTATENMRLKGHGFRVRSEGQVLWLEQRYADGSWGSYGHVDRIEGVDFTVFLHVPQEGDDAQQVQLLTIHSSGKASLLIHHGHYGNASQLARAWTYQGECLEVPG